MLVKLRRRRSNACNASWAYIDLGAGNVSMKIVGIICSFDLLLGRDPDVIRCIVYYQSPPETP